jgi:flagellar biosynthesis protein FlhG
VGKTSVSVNLALSLAGLGERVLVVDGDLGLGQVDLLLGAEPRLNLGHFFRGEASIREVMVIGPRGVSFLPSGCGNGELADLGPARRERLLHALMELAKSFDRIVLDLAAGIGANPIELASRCDEVLLVTTPEPTALTDAYAVAKVLFHRRALAPRVLVNRARSAEEARDAFDRLTRTAARHLSVAPVDWGFIPEDRAVAEAVSLQIPFVLGAPSSPSSRQVDVLARRLVAGSPEHDRPPVPAGTEPSSPWAA